LDFSCIEDCSKCCIEREYYPAIKFGKIGVLILPDEKPKIELLAKKHGLKVNILPRIGTSKQKTDKPEQVLAYQLMGREPNGNTCPFLDTESSERSPHGGYKCKIYQDRPTACRAYPLVESSPIVLDQKCKFCKTCKSPSGNLNSELESLAKIKTEMKTDANYVWRYATGVGEKEDRDKIESGWFLV
jgi:uncharacterized protein